MLLVSRDLGAVSTAVVAATAALHPFAWHHIFVPVLPVGLKARPLCIVSQVGHRRGSEK